MLKRKRASDQSRQAQDLKEQNAESSEEEAPPPQPEAASSTGTEAEQTPINETGSPASGTTSTATTSAATTSSSEDHVRFKPPSEISRDFRFDRRSETEANSRIASRESDVTAMDIPPIRPLPVVEPSVDKDNDRLEGSATNTRTEPAAGSFDPLAMKPEERGDRVRCLFRELLYENYTIEIGEEWSGHYNTTIQVILHAEDGNTFQYILRIPKWKYRQRLPDQVAILTYLRRFPELKAPRVQTYCLHSDNTFKYPFMVLNRFPGVCLDVELWRLSGVEKRSVAHQLGQYFKILAKPRSPRAGTVHMAQPDRDGDPTQPDSIPLCWKPMGRHSRETFEQPPGEDLNDGEFPTSTVQQIQVALASQESYLRQRFRNSLTEQIAHMFSVCKEILEDDLSVRHLFGDDGTPQEYEYCLLHRDLFARNIMIDFEQQPNGEESVIVTGIIDWDDAMFAPRQIAGRAPTWLWRPQYYGMLQGQSRIVWSALHTRIETEEGLTWPSTAPDGNYDMDLHQMFMQGAGSD